VEPASLRIAILGWGSLIWDPRDLPIASAWQSGPKLPIEFSRVSTRGNRQGCLTAVIDEQQGVDVVTMFALSPRLNLDDAIVDLRDREGTIDDRVGFLDLHHGTERQFARQHHPRACNTIKAWAVQQQLDAVVWTGLTSNFLEVVNVPFSVSAALEHLRGLAEPMRSHAFDYLRRAPAEVMTPLRRAANEAGLIKASELADHFAGQDDDAPEQVDGGDERFPWEHIDRARRNQRLQQRHHLDEAAPYRAQARGCPTCERTSSDLAWFYFESPRWTWENLCGRAG